MKEYRFSFPASVVEVTSQDGALFVTGVTRGTFKCLCRPYGQNNKGPRKMYIIVAASYAQAAQAAMQSYRKDCFDYGEERK